VVSGRNKQTTWDGSFDVERTDRTKPSHPTKGADLKIVENSSVKLATSWQRGKRKIWMSCIQIRNDRRIADSEKPVSAITFEAPALQEQHAAVIGLLLTPAKWTRCVLYLVPHEEHGERRSRASRQLAG
jgi:hypothetical protein